MNPGFYYSFNKYMTEDSLGFVIQRKR